MKCRKDATSSLATSSRELLEDFHENFIVEYLVKMCLTLPFQFKATQKMTESSRLLLHCSTVTGLSADHSQQ
jgi:hypothetical protein